MPYTPKFEIFKDKQKQFRFRLIARNGKIVATGEGYERKKDCIDTMNKIREIAPIAQVADMTE